MLWLVCGVLWMLAIWFLVRLSDPPREGAPQGGDGALEK
jgi:hypothetical protein